MVVNNLVKFHALSAWKLKNDPEFKSKVSKYAVPLALKQFTENYHRNNKIIYDKLKSDNEFKKDADKMFKLLEKSVQQNCKYNVEKPNDFLAIVHDDVYISNLLFHRDNAGKVDDVKIIDYQTYYIGNPLKDLFFFLLFSSNSDVLSNHLDKLFELYKNRLINMTVEENTYWHLSENDFNSLLKIAIFEKLPNLFLRHQITTSKKGLDSEELNDEQMRKIFKFFSSYFSV